MNKYLITAALAGVMAATASTAVFAADAAEKEKCYGIAEAGKNDCKSANASHSCAGHAAESHSKNEWKYVAKGECEGMGGSLTAGGEAKNSCKGKEATKNSCKGKEEGKNSCKGKEEPKNGCEGKAK